MIALAFPAALSIAMLVVQVPVIGLGVLIERIRERRRKPQSQEVWENMPESMEPRETEMPLLVGPEIGKDGKAQSNTFGTWSLVLGIIGVFWWPEALGVAAVVLGVLQFRRHTNKRAIAGFTLGVVDIVVAVLWHLLGLYHFGI